MYRIHNIELRGLKILVFLFVLQEKELRFPFIPAEKKVRSVAVRHPTLERPSTALYLK